MYKFLGRKDLKNFDMAITDVLHCYTVYYRHSCQIYVEKYTVKYFNTRKKITDYFDTHFIPTFYSVLLPIFIFVLYQTGILWKFSWKTLPFKDFITQRNDLKISCQKHHFLELHIQI